MWVLEPESWSRPAGGHSAMVVLVGHERDEHCDRLGEVLQARGREVVRLSLEQLPGQEFVWRPDGELRIGDVRLKSGRCSGLWRRPGRPVTRSFAGQYVEFVERECGDAFHGALAAISVRWLTDPLDLAVAELKLVQLRTAMRLGIEIPGTLVTNSAGDAVVFGEGHRATVVKPVRYGLVSVSPQPRVAWTTRVSTAELKELCGPPVIVQELVAAARHLRVVTVGRRAYVAWLEADGDIDWRARLEHHEQFKKAMPNESSHVEGSAIRLALALRLGFSAQDWILTSAGESIFLEANPNGQWLFLDGVHDGGITAALADELEALEEQA